MCSLIRPRNQRRQRQQQVSKQIAVGDTVMLTSGIIGRVEGFVGDRAKIEIAPGMTIEVVRQAVAQRVDPDRRGRRRAPNTTARMTTTITTTWSTTPITTRTPCLRSRPVIRPIPETKRTGAIRAGTEAEAVALEKGLAPQRHPHLRCLLRIARRRRRCRLVPKAGARPRRRPVRRLPAGREGDDGELHTVVAIMQARANGIGVSPTRTSASRAPTSSSSCRA